MKQSCKKINIAMLSVVLTLIFLLSVNVAYAYFTAEDALNGGFSFYNFEINFIVKEGTSIVGEEIAGTTYLPVVPTESLISKGTPFKIRKPGGTADLNVGFKLKSGSCGAYLRYWVDAYIDGDTSKNYGCYFELGRLNDGNFTAITSKKETSDAVNDYVTYFLEIESTVSDIMAFNAIRLVDDTPTDIMGKSLNLSISFDAVQQANQAYLAEYTDIRGYDPNWR